MSNYTIGQADTSGALTDIEDDITDAQFAETIGASAVAKFTVFGSQDGIARFVEYVMAYNATVADELVD